jgi:hypothetical protein
MAEGADYTKDWEEYWRFRYSQKVRGTLQRAAESPKENYLPVKPSQLNPNDDDYDWNIRIEDLREKPDSVLRDAREGFSRFVSQDEILDENSPDYDFLPINFTENRYKLRDIFWVEPTIEPNTIIPLSGEISSPANKRNKAAAISYQCPTGHNTRVVQPTYTNHTIDLCGEEACTGSVYTVSRETQVIEVVDFTISTDDGEIDCVAAGSFTRDRALEKIQQKGTSLALFGILRNVISEDGGVSRVFEALSIDT